LSLQSNGGTTAITVDTSQNVGIGTASPTAKLHTLVTGVTAGIKSETSGSFGGIEVKATNGVTQDWIVAADASGSGKFAIYDAVAGQYRMQINGTGNVVLSGGTATASGVGITFPATQSASSDANCLDDYEEGTWTPTITSGGGSITSYSSVGRYVKIGNAVTVYFSFTLTNAGTASGNGALSGLPFNAYAAGAGGGNRAAIALIREDAVTGLGYQLAVNSSTNNGLMQSLTGTALAWVTNYCYDGSLTYITS
jgi:hypothetical protein